uniref:Uncharacterized protein n=1 Tax=Bracon brevicornis TaxID=1563983 RepID=A0A6V7KCA6_9HYME
MAFLTQQQDKEHHRTNDAQNHTHRDLKRITNHPPNHVAQQHQSPAKQAHPGNGFTHIVTKQHTDQVRHDQTEERQRTDHHHHHPADDGNNCQPEQHHLSIVETDVDGKLAPHARNSEAICRPAGNQRKNTHQPQQFVTSALHTGEIT